MPPAKIMILPPFEAWMPKNWPPDWLWRGEVLGGDVEGPRGVGLLDRDVDRAEPGLVHADVGDEVAAGVGDRDVHRLADFGRLLLCCFDDPLGVFECDHVFSSVCE